MVELKKQTIEQRSAYSKLQEERVASRCIKPRVVLADSVHLIEKEALGAKDHHDRIKALFPATYGRPRVELVPGDEHNRIHTVMTVGVVLSGGQAPGGHNVIAGVFDYVKKASPEGRVIGFLNGPHGVMNGIYAEIDAPTMDRYRNTGGFDMLGSGRHKIETAQQMADSREVCEKLRLTGLIVIGGDDSNTNAALLAEYFESSGCKTKVAGCPKTIDGDLKNEYVPISFGFDTAAKTFSEEIGNVALDALASQKYYHFIRLMGRAASNIALECALQTRPNCCLISEEVEAKGASLVEITHQLVDMILARAKLGKNFGVVMLPEGLIEFIPEFNALIAQINDVLASGVPPTEEAVLPALTRENRMVFNYLPQAIKLQLLLDRDPHGNVQVAKIETERLLAMTVGNELERLRGEGKYSGAFSPQFHSFGYEGRCALPSHFDCSYTYSLGYTAAVLIAMGRNSLMASVNNLHAPIEDWTVGGVPITMMCHMERRKGKDKPVIKKALVELEGKPFAIFKAQRAKWALHDMYRAPGPIQFFSEGARDINFTLLYELLGDKAEAITECSLAVTVAPVLRPMGVKSKYLFRPTPPALRSHVEQSRLTYEPKLPPALRAHTVKGERLVSGEPTLGSNMADRQLLQRVFPATYGAPLLRLDADYTVFDESLSAPAVKVGVVFCGRQAAGGHNILWGVHEFLKGTKSKVLGFVGGTHGLFDEEYVEVTDALLSGYRNQGGFDLLGRSVDAIKTEDQVNKARKACERLKLDGLVLIGGNRTHTDAAYLAEHFKASGVRTAVVGVPCSISGAMKNQFVESAVGFDTAVKVYSQLVGNTAIDAASCIKYWYFMRLMGQDPSHIALETALQTNPNVVLLAEEVAAKRWSLIDIVREVADKVQERAAGGKDYGTVLVPEGLIAAIPEMSVLIEEIDAIYAEAPANANPGHSVDDIVGRLTRWSAALLSSLPPFIQSQFCLERQSNQKVQLSQIETEKMLVHFVEEELSRRAAAGLYKGKFSAVCSYLGYQARSATPSNFDCDYGFTLGGAAAALAHRGVTGVLATVTNLREAVSEWKVGGVPLTAMLVADGSEKMPSGQVRPVIPPTSVDLNGPAMRKLQHKMLRDQMLDAYRNPGPIQFGGDTADNCVMTLALESGDYLGQLSALREALKHIEEACRPGCSSRVLSISTKTLKNLTETVDTVAGW